MVFRIGIENNMDGRSLAWFLEYPGCFAYGQDGDCALRAAPAAVREYIRWLAGHTPESWFPEDAAEIRLEETWECFYVDEQFERQAEGYEVGAWFLNDWKPLTPADIERGLQILSWSRADLLETLAGLSAATLERQYPGERWNIAGIARHIGGAEWWYLERLGLAFPQEQLPRDPFERLEKVRQWLVDTLPTLAGSRQVTGVDAEFWSPRKLLRRATWHERDHVEHIRKLLAMEG